MRLSDKQMHLVRIRLEQRSDALSGETICGIPADRCLRLGLLSRRPDNLSPLRASHREIPGTETCSAVAVV